MKKLKAIRQFYALALAAVLTLTMTLGASTGTVLAKESSDTITVVDALAEGANAITVESGTAETDIPFPALTANSGMMELSGISWECANYDGNTPGEYTFAPVIPASYSLDDNVSLPSVTVTVKDNAAQEGSLLPQAELTFTDMITSAQPVGVDALQLNSNMYLSLGINGDVSIADGAKITISDKADETTTYTALVAKGILTVSGK